MSESLDTKLGICPECSQSSVVCSYEGDQGSVDRNIDVYSASCVLCAYEHRTEIDAGSFGSDRITNCPYCGIDMLKHSNKTERGL